MEDSPLLDEYLLSLVGRERPRICFVGTASGDNENYIVRFYRRFNRAQCEPSHLDLFRRDGRDLTEFARTQDIIYVGGGNTANMLAVWRVHGFVDALREALHNGTILAGLSAGSICWFESGVTDSFGSELRALDCLGFLSGSHCPHYDGEPTRRPAYHRLVAEGMSPGVAADDSVALHYLDGQLHRTVSSRREARAYRVGMKHGEVIDMPIEPEYLGVT